MQRVQNSGNMQADLFQQALTLHQQGKLQDAKVLYEKLLSGTPRNADALYLLGLIAAHERNSVQALRYFDKAARINPNSALLWSNRGNILQALGQFDAAVVSYDKAITLFPDYVSYGNRGDALQALKQFDAAVASYDKALALKPDCAEVHNNRGNALQELGQFDAAIASYDKAIALQPGCAETHNGRGTALTRLEQWDAALASYDKAIALKPDYADPYSNRGKALQELKQLDAAVASCEKAIALKPDYAEAYANRGNALQELGRFDAALASYDKAIALKPDYAEVYSSRGIALQELMQFDAALASYDKAIALKPGLADAYWGKSLALLVNGDFEQGWKLYESRWADVTFKSQVKRRFNSTCPIWKGEELTGKRVIVYEEQGLGDIIQFSRYLIGLFERGAQVTFLVRSGLHRLMRSFGPIVRLTDRQPVNETFDYQCALLSLPAAFRTSLDCIPARIPYLMPEDALAADWRQRIGSGGFKIGICWQGASVSRSIPLRCFQPLTAIRNVRLISLQKEHGLDQLATLPPGMEVETLGKGFDSGADAFIDTAAVISCLDLVITADTSIAHVAGALGRHVWVVLKWAPEWRWMRDRSDSPWYPTMTLYRQAIRDDWDEVFHRIAADLATSSMGVPVESVARPPPNLLE